MTEKVKKFQAKYKLAMLKDLISPGSRALFSGDRAILMWERFDHIAFIQYMFVDPKHRRQGIMTGLLRGLCEYKFLKEITFAASTEPSRSFGKSLGFVETWNYSSVSVMTKRLRK